MSSPATSQPSTPAAEARPSSGAPRAAEARALHSGRAHLCFWLVMVLGLALDLGSKEWAFHTLRQGGGRVLIPHVLELQTAMNAGAVFGLGHGQTAVFLVASALALILVLWMFAQSSARTWLLHIALGAILAGALGNMYDRICVRLVAWRDPGATLRYYVQSESPDGQRIVLREYPPRADGPARELPTTVELPPPVGYVRDFIKIPTRILGERELWPWVFNVADTLLVSGVAILAVRLWRDRGRGHRRRPGELDAAAGGA